MSNTKNYDFVGDILGGLSLGLFIGIIMTAAVGHSSETSWCEYHCTPFEAELISGRCFCVSPEDSNSMVELHPYLKSTTKK